MSKNNDITWTQIKDLIPIIGMIVSMVLGYAGLSNRISVIETKIDYLTQIIKNGGSEVDKENLNNINTLSNRVSILESKIK